MDIWRAHCSQFSCSLGMSGHVRWVPYQMLALFYSHMHRLAEQAIDIQYMFYKHRYTVTVAERLGETGGDAVTFCQGRYRRWG